MGTRVIFKETIMKTDIFQLERYRKGNPGVNDKVLVAQLNCGCLRVYIENRGGWRSRSNQYDIFCSSSSSLGMKDLDIKRSR